MKKRILALLLVMACLISVSACSGPAESTTKPNTSTTTAGNNHSQPAQPSENNTPTTGGTNVTNPPAVDETKTIEIVEKSAFSSGVAWVKVTDSTIPGDTGHWGLIDATGKLLYDDPAYEWTEYHTPPKFFHGVTGGYTYGTPFQPSTIYDTSFQVVASPETKGYDGFIADYSTAVEAAHACGRFLVYKVEESFSGDTYSFGVLDAEGNYVVPLSEDHPIAALMAEKNYVLNSSSSETKLEIYYYGNNVFRLDGGAYPDDYSGYYNIFTNEITPDYVHYGHEGWHDNVLVKYDTQGNTTVVAEGENFKEIEYGVWLFEKDGKYTLMDFNTNETISYGDYYLQSDKWHRDEMYYHNGYLLIPIRNSQNTEYLCLFDKSGEPAFEPIRGYGSYSELTDEGFITLRDGINFYNYEGFVSNQQFENLSSKIYGYEDGWALVMTSTVGSWKYYYTYILINANGERLHS